MRRVASLAELHGEADEEKDGVAVAAPSSADEVDYSQFSTSSAPALEEPAIEEDSRVARILEGDETEKGRITEYESTVDDIEGFDTAADYLAGRTGDYSTFTTGEELAKDYGYELPEPPSETYAPLSITELAESEKFTKLARKYLSGRIGKDAVAGLDDNEDLVRRYLEHTRALSTNMGSVAKELSYIRTLSDADKRDVAKLYQIDPFISSAGSKGGDHLWNAVANYGYYAITDPSNVITLGSGLLVKQFAGKAIGNMALREAVKSHTAAILGTATVDGVLGYMEASDRQSIDIEAGLREEKDFTEIGIQTALQTAIGGGVTAFGVYAGATGKSAGKKLDDKLAKNFGAGYTDPAKQAKMRREEMEKFDPLYGVKIKEQLSSVGKREGDTVEPQVRLTTAENVTYAIADWASKNKVVADQIAIQMKDEKTLISDVVMDILSKEDNIASGVFDDLADALVNAGVTYKDFGQALRSTARESAQFLNNLSQLSKKTKKLAAQDPHAARMVERIFEAEDVAGPISRAYDVLRRADSESRALMVAGIGTTVANAFGGVAYVGFRTFADAIDTTLYHGGKAIGSVFGMEASSDKAKRGLMEVFRDSTSLLTRLVKQGESAEIADRILKDAPELSDVLFHTTQGLADRVGQKELSAVSKAANTLNRLQDGIFRRAILASRVDHYLKRNNLGSLEEYLAANKPIPKAILKKATDDALYGTFAYMPKQKPLKDGVSLKSRAESFGNSLVRMTEALPFVPGVGTGDHPFMRFMLNAISFQYKYSPLQAGTAVTDSLNVLYKAGKKQDINPAELAKIREKIGTSAVGSAALMAAIAYREENQDTKWYQIKDDMGRPVDTRSLFPAAPYLVVADLIVKMREGKAHNMDVATIFEGLTGSQVKTGGMYGMDLLKDVITDSIDGTDSSGNSILNAEKLAERVGAYLGMNTVGRVLTPTQIVSDIIAANDREESVIRDRNQLEGETPLERMLEAGMQQVQYKTPYWQQSLPPLKSGTREGPIYREDTSIRQLTRARVESKPNVVEAELQKYGMSPNAVLPKTPDAIARDAYAEAAQPFVSAFLTDFVTSESYKGMSPSEKKVAFKNRLNDIRSIVQDVAGAKSVERTQSGEYKRDYVHRGLWMRLPSDTRRLANEFLKEKGQPTVEESGNFLEGIYLARDLKGSL